MSLTLKQLFEACNACLLLGQAAVLRFLLDAVGHNPRWCAVFGPALGFTDLGEWQMTAQALASAL